MKKQTSCVFNTSHPLNQQTPIDGESYHAIWKRMILFLYYGVAFMVLLIIEYLSTPTIKIKNCFQQWVNRNDGHDDTIIVHNLSIETFV